MSRPVYLSWQRYQRRSDVLGELLGAEVLRRPATKPSRLTRPVDYLSRGVQDFRVLHRRQPLYAVVQTPPLPPALAPYLRRVPYVVDAHNGQFQSWWRSVPATAAVLRRAAVVLTHTDEADELARRMFRGVRTLVVHDPLRPFEARPVRPESVFVVASLGADEPMDVLVDAVAALPDIRFTTTAPLDRLDRSLRARVRALPNLTTTGFLPVPDYEAALATAAAVVVLTNREATQPSGACEALSAGRPLVVSRTRTTAELFGSFATLVDNRASALVDGIRSALADGRTDRIEAARCAWMARTADELRSLAAYLPAQVPP